MNPYQEAYFRFMTQTREHVFYISEHIARAHKWNRRVNMFMAITSSSSIGAWVIWQKLSWIWASVIAASQVLGAVKEHLPFKRRLSVLYQLRNQIERLCIDAEKNWYSVANGELTEGEIHLRTIELKDKGTAIEQEHLSGIVLPEEPRLIFRAREKNRVYFENCMLGGDSCLKRDAEEDR